MITKREKFLLVCLTIMLVFVASLLSQNPKNINKIPITVTKITDGDTVRAKINDEEFSIRLKGIDCFETSQEYKRTYNQAKYNNISIQEVVKRGLASKNYLESLYANSSKKTFLEFQGIDKYSRALGVLYFGDLNVNQKMLDDGGCMVYVYKNSH